MGAYGSPELYPKKSPPQDTNAIYCQKCGFRYSRRNKKCPECGLKHNMRFYNKWWFWVLAAIVVLAIYPQSPKNMNEKTKPTSQALSESEYKESCIHVSYDDIERNPQNYKGAHATYIGKVIQVWENGENVVLRVNVAKDEQGVWDDAFYVEYKRKSSDEPRILNDDIVTLYGTIEGTKSYTSVRGDQVTIPYMKAEYITID